MNWKSTIALSGAGLIATWLASAPSVRSPIGTRAMPAPAAANSPEAATDIARQADRLRARLQTAAVYQEPTRNPFRFGERLVSRHAVDATPGAPAIASTPEATPAPPALAIRLSGIAEDTVDGHIVRTAIISSAQDVVLVKEGDTVDGQFRVTRITADVVELANQTDNSVVQLRLQP